MLSARVYGTSFKTFKLRTALFTVFIATACGPQTSSDTTSPTSETPVGTGIASPTSDGGSNTPGTGSNNSPPGFSCPDNPDTSNQYIKADLSINGNPTQAEYFMCDLIRVTMKDKMGITEDIIIKSSEFSFSEKDKSGYVTEYADGKHLNISSLDKTLELLRAFKTTRTFSNYPGAVKVMENGEQYLVILRESLASPKILSGPALY